MVDIETELREQTELVKLLTKRLSRQDSLFRELSHRVTNGFHSVAARLRVEARNVNDPEGKAICIKMAQHIESMAMVHRRLYEATSVSKLNLGEYLASLCRDLAGSVVRKNVHISSSFDEDINMNAEQVTTIGTMVVELVMNATKHAFDGKNGQIEIVLRKSSDEIEICVSDNGKGLPKEFDVKSQSGLGIKLALRQAQSMHGTLRIDSSGDGTTFKIILPLPSEDDIEEKSHSVDLKIRETT